MSIMMYKILKKYKNANTIYNDITIEFFMQIFAHKSKATL